MNKTSRNITFIGMAGSGKSCIGEVLAKKIGYIFIDTDDEIRRYFNEQSLEKVLKEAGSVKFKEVEDRVIQKLRSVCRTVIAPGGSVVYSKKSINLLSDISTIIYLEVSPEIIKRRIDVTTRGIIGFERKGLEALMEERAKLYEENADVTIDGSGSIHKVLDLVCEALLKRE